VQGRSNLILRLEIIKKIIAIPIIIICVFFGIKVMIMGMIVISLIAYYLNSYWSGELIDYSMFEQLKDILPSFLLALFMGSVVYMAGLIIKTSPPLTLIIQISLGALLSLGLSEMFKLKEYLYIKEIFIKKLKETIVQ